MIGPTVLSDLRLALRTLRHGKGIAGLAVGTIALVICGVTLITSVLVGALIDRGPYRTPARVVGLQFTAPTLPYPRIYFPHDDYLTLREATTGPGGLFDALTPLGIAYVMMTNSGEPAHLNAGVMPGETFDLLGVSPLLGRTLTREDDRPDAPAVLVIGEEVWRQSFGGDPHVVGRTVRIDNHVHEVVGVMPRRFTWGVLNAWLPMRLDLYGSITGRFVQITGWLRDGVSEAHALSRLDVLLSGLTAAHADTYPASASIAFAQTALPAVRDEVRESLVLLFVSVTLLAIVGCVNVAALLLARTTGRMKELSIRVSLGASRGQIVRAQLLEACVLAMAGAVAGVALAYLLLPALLASLPAGVLPLGAVVAVDARVLAWMAAATVAVSLACGVLPALLVTRVDVEASLRQTAKGSLVSSTSRRVWRVLIGVEVAMAMTLLVLTAVFGRSLLALRAAPLHYSPDRVAALGVTLSTQRYPTLPQSARFLQHAAERIRAIPGVEHAAVAFPAGPRNNTPSSFELSGRAASATDRVGVRMVGADFFKVYRVSTVRGRALDRDDERMARRVAVVNEAFTRQFGATADVLGRQVRLPALHAVDDDGHRDGGGTAPVYEIVGVVRDVANNPRTGGADPEVSVLATTAALGRNWFLVVRATGGDVTTLVKPMQQAVWALDPDQAFRSIRTEDDMLWIARFGWPTFRALLLGLFGGLALALVGGGAYGIVSYSTAREARDLGIRLAIGSPQGAIARHVVARGLGPVFAGIVAGAGLAAAGGTLVRTFVGSVSPWDPIAYLAATATLVIVAAVACAVPARRASRLDPSVVLRSE